MKLGKVKSEVYKPLRPHQAPSKGGFFIGMSKVLYEQSIVRQDMFACRGYSRSCYHVPYIRLMVITFKR